MQSVKLVYSEEEIVTDMTYIVEGGRDLDSSDEHWEKWREQAQPLIRANTNAWERENPADQGTGVTNVNDVNAINTGFASDNSDEYWDEHKREFDAKRAQDPEGHKMFVMQAWLRKHPGKTMDDYAIYRREHDTTPSEDQQVSPPSPHTVRNLEVADRRSQDAAWVRQPRPQPSQTMPELQHKFTAAEGVPSEHWNLTEEQYIAKVAEHRANDHKVPHMEDEELKIAMESSSKPGRRLDLAHLPGQPRELWCLNDDELKVAINHPNAKPQSEPVASQGRGRGIQTRNAPNKMHLPIAMPYQYNTTPDQQTKRAKWLAAMQAMHPLSEEQLAAPEVSKVQLTASTATVDIGNQSDAEFVKSTNTTIKNIIGCVNELQDELDKLMDIYNEHYDRAQNTFDEQLLYKFDRVMELYDAHCGLLDIARLDMPRNQRKSVMSAEMAAKMRFRLNNSNNDNKQ
jgi:hypothetical protein